MSNLDKVSSGRAGAHFATADPSKKEDNITEISVRLESGVVAPNNLSTAKSSITQQTAPKIVRHHLSESVYKIGQLI